MKNLKTAKLTRLALLMAITILFAATPLGYLLIGPVSFTIMVLPVAVGGVLMGPVAGAILGLTFGITSLLKAPGEALGQLIISYSGFFTVFVCVVPRLAVGIFAGFMSKFIAKTKNEKSPLLLAACGATASLINTTLFIGFIFIFCRPLIEGAFGIAIWGSVLLGGTFEFIANGILTAAIALPLKRFFK